MNRLYAQKGFTLVELAIVLVIVGLLIGGILKGQELMQNARVTASVAQVKSMEAAVTNFYDMYKEKPGDLTSPDTRIKDCATICALEGVSGNQLGNGKIGTVDWDYQTSQITPWAGVVSTTPVAGETVLFWYELLKTGLISGVTDEGLNGSTATLGGVIPEMKVGGGLWVGNSSGQGVTTPANLGKTVAPTVRGTVLVAVTKPAVGPSTTIGVQPLYPRDAANIDRKLDDGLPNSGIVQAIGGSSTSTGYCFNNTNNIYMENQNSKDCSLIMRIFK